jgi:hypothetical protein
MTPAEPSVAFAYPADDAPEIDATAAVYQRAVEFAFGLINRSRTEQAARVRLAAARYVITARYEKPDRICKRLKISKRRFFEVCRQGSPNLAQTTLRVVLVPRAAWESARQQISFGFGVT